MVIQVRSFTEADAEALADLLNRNAYGLREYGTTLTATQLLEVFAERCVEGCVVGDDGEALRGCVALSIGSGRRAAASHERFAGLFVIDDRYRNSMLAGKLLRALFVDRVRSGGVRTLRIEANPTNTRAFPLYLRVGFRAAPGARPDEDGYVELVSHLPGVVNDLTRANPGADVGEVAGTPDWRMVRSGRDIGPAEGVSRRDGRLVVNYAFDTGDREVVVVVDYSSGSVVAVEQSRGPSIAVPEEAPVPGLEPCLVIERISLADSHALLIADDGTVELRREVAGSEPVVILRERWPVALGEDAPAVRRQGLRRHVRVQRTERVWHLVADGDTTCREIRVDEDGLGLEFVTWPGHEGVAVTVPWVTMRVAEHALLGADGKWLGGPVLPGRWPRDWGDFEAAQEALEATAGWWSDGRTSLTVQWIGIARASSRGAPALRSAYPGGEVRLRLELGGEAPTFASSTEGMHRVPAARPLRRGAIPSNRAEASAPFEVIADHGKIRDLRAGDQRLRLAPDAGIVEWGIGDVPILRGPYPSGAPFGSLAARRTGLWCTGLASRDDADQGVEWADDRVGLDYLEASASLYPGSWQLSIDGAEGLRVRAEAGAAETAVHLVPNTGGASELVVDVLNCRWIIEPGYPWRGAVNAAAVVLRDGKWLVVSPVGRRAELFLRSMDSGLLFTALAVGSLELGMQVVGSRVQAERLLATTAGGSAHE